jgi:small-conductance mechanosensitive channel
VADHVLVPFVAVIVGVVVALVVAAVLEAVARRIAPGSPLAAELLHRCHRPVRAILVVVLGWIALQASTTPAKWRAVVSHSLTIVLIALAGWLLIGVLYVLEDAAVRRYDAATTPAGPGDRQARRVQTQAQILRRIGVAIIVVCTLGAALLTFPEVRVIGASILASAGLLSVVAGLAAQTTLGNVFAGLQLAFTDAIRMGDSVVVQGQKGEIEEVTLTYVGVRLWDDRRVIVPSGWFTTTPFENWTHTGVDLLGTVEMDVDWSVPLEGMRAELDRVLAASQEWDGRTGKLQVTDAIGGPLRIRVLVSAADSGKLFNLRCEVREALAAWVVRESPGSLPRYRIRPGGVGTDGAVAPPTASSPGNAVPGV